MGPYLELYYRHDDTTADREQVCRELVFRHVRDVLPGRVYRVRLALDEVAFLAARPNKVRKQCAWRLNTHLDEMLIILKQARLSDTRLACEIAAVLAVVRDSGEKHPNFTRGSTLPDWATLALPVLHAAWCHLSPDQAVYRERNVPSPALKFMTDAINLFRAGTTVSVVDRLWLRSGQTHPNL